MAVELVNEISFGFTMYGMHVIFIRYNLLATCRENTYCGIRKNVSIPFWGVVYIFGNNQRDINLVLENIVYLEWLRYRYVVAAGKRR